LRIITFKILPNFCLFSLLWIYKNILTFLLTVKSRNQANRYSQCRSLVLLSLVHIDRRRSTIHCLWATKKKIHKTFYASMTTDNGHRRCLRSMWTRLNSMHALHSSAVITNVYCNVFKIRHYIRPFFVNVDTLCTDSLVTTRYRPL
jgi:hypothetical protein